MARPLTFRVALYDAVASGVSMGVIGLLAMGVREPWLFPSLGPTIFLQTVAPEERASKPWSVLVGHAIGGAAGFGAVYLCGAAVWSAALGPDGPTGPRVLATLIAVTATMAGQRLVRAMHPPAAATTMLIALGSLPATWHSAGAVASGVLLVCAIGEASRLLRRKLGPRLGWPEQRQSWDGKH
jgi:hypothetical protein